MQAATTWSQSPTSTKSAYNAYLDALGQHQPFGPDNELGAARKLMQSRQQRWNALLSYPPLTKAISERLQSQLELDAETTELLKSLAERSQQTRKARTHATREAFEQCAAAVAERLLDLDTDHRVAEELIQDVWRLDRGERDGLRLQIRRLPSRDLPFRSFVEACRSIDRSIRHQTQTFANANLRLVVRIARRYAQDQLPMSDLVQEGNLGLLRAIDRFDHRKGFRFSTYATWWIRHAIGRAIYNTGRQIRLPVHVHDARQKVNRMVRSFEATNGRAPTPEEIASATGVSPDKIDELRSFDGRSIVSLNAPASGDDDRETVELMESQDEDTSELIEHEQLRSGLDEALDELGSMEADILKRRFGLGGTPRETLREIGGHYGLSRERIRQLQERALDRLRGHLGEMHLL